MLQKRLIEKGKAMLMIKRATNKKSCCICEEVQTGNFPEEYSRYYAVSNRICYESRHFLVVPSVSPIHLGHVLVFPRVHVTNLIEMPAHTKRDLYGTVTKIYYHLVNHFGRPYVFEHGVTKNAGTACGISHAHLHLVPLNREAAEGVDQAVSARYEPDTSGSIRQIIGNRANGVPYLIYGESLDSLSITFANNIPSQFMRRCIAEVLGDNRWDWKEFYGGDRFRETQLTFHKFRWS